MVSEKIISLVENLIMSLILFGLLMVGLTSDASKTIALLIAVPITVIYFCIMCSAEASGFLNDVPNDTFRKHFYSNIHHDSDAPPYMRNATKHINRCTVQDTLIKKEGE